MKRTFLKSRSQGLVTEDDLDYEGSLGIKEMK